MKNKLLILGTVFLIIVRQIKTPLENFQRGVFKNHETYLFFFAVFFFAFFFVAIFISPLLRVFLLTLPTS